MRGGAERISNREVTAVIVNWQSYDLVGRCIAALEAGKPQIPRQIIVVDNSQDEANRAQWRRRTDRGVEWMFNPRNVGFAAACNQGIGRARGDYLLLLNPDAEVAESTVDRMAELLDRHPDLAAIGAQLLNSNGTRQPSAYQLYPGLLRAFLDLSGLRYAWLFVQRSRHDSAGKDLMGLRPAAWLKGACMMIRREAFDAIGPFDESFFLYAEDVDWCYRAHRAGWHIALATGCLATHVGERSMSQDRLAGISAYYASYLHFILKHQGPGPLGLRAAAARMLLKLGAATRLVAFAAASLLRPEQSSEARAYWRYLTAS